MSLTLIALVAGTVTAAAIDVRSRRIPNALTIAMVIAALALHLADGLFALLIAIGAVFAVFALGALGFAAGWFGGGDVKLLSAACGLVSFPGCASLIVFVLIAGAILALVEAARGRRLATLVRNASSLLRGAPAPESLSTVPYGVAIAGGSTAYALSTLIPALRFPA